MWLDGLYMGEPFYALYADAFDILIQSTGIVEKQLPSNRRSRDIQGVRHVELERRVVESQSERRHRPPSRAVDVELSDRREVVRQVQQA